MDEGKKIKVEFRRTLSNLDIGKRAMCFPTRRGACGLVVLGLLVLFPGHTPPLAAKEKPRVSYSIPLPPAPDFSPLDWLIGEWTGKTSGRDTPGDVHLSAAYELDRHVIILRETVSLPASPSAPEISESWIGVLAADLSGKFILRIFSTTGFITRYRVSVDKAEIQLTPEGGDHPPPGWLFRREIVRTETDGLTDTVQTAPPGKAFFNYYTAQLHRAKPPASP